MKLEQLYQIIEIEKQHSISKAAKSLYIGRPSLSESLNSLEEEIGVSLFERMPGGVVATPEGLDILRIAKRILEGVDEILDYRKQIHQLHGDVEFYISPSFRFIFSTLLLEFQRNFPKAKLNLKTMSSEEVIETISDGRGSLGLIMWGCLPQHKLSNLQSIGIDYEAFRLHTMFLYVSKNNPLSKENSVTLEKLRNEKFIAYSLKQWTSINQLVQADSDALLIIDRGTMMEMISQNRGVTILPETLSEGNLYYYDGSIKMIPIEGDNNFRDVIECLIWTSKRRLTLLEEKTLLLIKEILLNFENNGEMK